MKCDDNNDINDDKSSDNNNDNDDDNNDINKVRRSLTITNYDDDNDINDDDNNDNNSDDDNNINNHNNKIVVPCSIIVTVSASYVTLLSYLLRHCTQFSILVPLYLFSLSAE